MKRRKYSQIVKDAVLKNYLRDHMPMSRVCKLHKVTESSAWLWVKEARKEKLIHASPLYRTKAGADAAVTHITNGHATNEQKAKAWTMNVSYDNVTPASKQLAELQSHNTALRAALDERKRLQAELAEALA